MDDDFSDDGAENQDIIGENEGEDGLSLALISTWLTVGLRT